MARESWVRAMAAGIRKVTTKRGVASAKKAKRRTQDERRRATQDAILKAAIDLLVEEGYARFSTIAVAKRARVSRGARENYYPSKYDLIAAAWEAALTRARDRAQAMVGRQDGVSAVDGFLTDYESFYLSHVYMALMELQVAARTDARLSRLFHRLYAKYRRSHDDIWIEAMVAEGYARDRVEIFLRATQYLLRGMALTSVWDISKAGFRGALREWRAQAPTYLAGTRSRSKQRPIAANRGRRRGK